MHAKPLKSTYELGDMIVEQAAALQGPWPVGMTLFIFDDAYGWSATISRPSSEADNFFRTSALDLIARLAAEYERKSTPQEAGKAAFENARKPKRREPR